jgi:hypothetical protein
VGLRGVALVSAVVAAGCGGGTSSAAESPHARDLTLRLSDVPRGYVVDDDTGCSDGMGVEDGPARLDALARKLRPQLCSVQLRRAWASSSERQPSFVASVAIVTNEDGARELLDDGLELLGYFFGYGEFELAAEQPQLGEDARFVRTRNANVAGHIGNPGSAVLWRSGPVLGIVYAAETVATGLDERVLELAAVQQRRFEDPTPLQPSELDDREVELDNPALGMRVVWLGRTFASKGLPRLELGRGFGPLGPGESPGNRVHIDYTRPDRDGPGVMVLLWTRPSWDRFTKTRLGRLVWASPCARATRVRVRGGTAVIYAGYARGGTRRPCPRAAPDRFLAHVFFRDLVVTVNMPFCFLCIARGADPYNTLHGLRAVVQSLRERP